MKWASSQNLPKLFLLFQNLQNSIIFEMQIFQYLLFKQREFLKKTKTIWSLNHWGLRSHSNMILVLHITTRTEAVTHGDSLDLCQTLFWLIISIISLWYQHLTNMWYICRCCFHYLTDFTHDKAICIHCMCVCIINLNSLFNTFSL